MYIHIYIYRERERERETYSYLYIPFHFINMPSLERLVKQIHLTGSCGLVRRAAAIGPGL